jgi:hypothetical protein
MLASADGKEYWPFGAPNGTDANWGHLVPGHRPCDPNDPPHLQTASEPDFACDNPPNVGPAGTYSGSLLNTSRYYSWMIQCVRGEPTQSVVSLSQAGCAVLQSPYGCSDEDCTTYYGYGWSISYVQLPGAPAGELVKTLSHAGSNTYNYVKVS